MKKFLLATALTMVTTTSAFADKKPIEPYDWKSWDVYVNEEVRTPSVVTTCKIVSVPVYGTIRKNGSAAEAITGGVIGGVIGNQFGSGSGKDAMTILGIIVGANAANGKEQVITEYRNEKRCTDVTTYEISKVKTYSHSVIQFYRDGQRYRMEFQK